MSKQMKYDAGDLEIHVQRGDTEFDVLKICDTSLEWIDDKSYFKLTLRFPNGSFRQLFIHENALLSKNGSRVVERIDVDSKE